MSSANVNVLGTWKPSKTVSVNVLGTWKNCKSVWANVLGTWKQVYQALGSFSVVAGSSGLNRGYSSGAYGSITGGSIGGGLTVTIFASNSGNLTLEIDGFSSAPAQTFFTSITINGSLTLNAASASSFSTTSTTGQWTWNGVLTLVSGNTYSVDFS